jgi:hypothetical protein
MLRAVPGIVDIDERGRYPGALCPAQIGHFRLAFGRGDRLLGIVADFDFQLARGDIRPIRLCGQLNLEISACFPPLRLQKVRGPGSGKIAESIEQFGKQLIGSIEGYGIDFQRKRELIGNVGADDDSRSVVPRMSWRPGSPLLFQRGDVIPDGSRQIDQSFGK